MADEKDTQDLSGSNDDKIIKMILANKAESEKYLNNNYTGDWKSFYNNYRCISDGKPYTWMSDQFLPMTHAHVETAVSQVMSILFSVTPAVQVKPREKGDNESAKVIEQLIAYDFQVSKFYLKFMEFVKNLLIYGTAIGKVTWKYKQVKRKIKAPNMVPQVEILGVGIGKKQSGYKGEEKVIVEYDDPYFENCNLNDIFYDPCSIDIQDSWVIHRVKRNKSYLKGMLEQGIYNDQVTKLIAEVTKSDDSNPGMKDIEESTNKGNDGSITRAKGTENIELLEWWGDYDLDGNGNVKPCLFTLANGKYLIRKDENPFWHGKKPFIKGVYIPMPNEFHGIGIPEIIYGVQNTANEVVNQRLDNISFVLNRMYIYKKQAGVDVNKLVSKPGGTYGADELDAISPQTTPDVTASAYRETAELERWAQEADAVTKITMGTVGAGTADTLGGMQIQQAAAGNRFMMYNKIIENMSFIEVVKFMYELNQQFIDKNKVIRIVGDMGVNYVTVPPEDILKEYDFIPAGVLGMENRMEKALKLIQFKSISKDDNAIKMDEIDKKILQYMGFPDTTEFIRTPQEQQAELMKQMLVMKAKMDMETEANMQMASHQQAITPPKEGSGGSPMVEGGANVQPPGVPPPNAPPPPGGQVGGGMTL